MSTVLRIATKAPPPVPAAVLPLRGALRPLRLAVALVCALLCCQVASAQVTLFNEPPTSDEILQALSSRAAAEATSGGPRSRGVRFGHDAQRTATTGAEGGASPDGAVSASAAKAAPAADAAAGGTATSGATTANAVPPGAVAAARNGPAVAMRLVFDYGSARLARQSLPFLVSLAGALRRDPSLRLTVEGHTDNQGDPAANLVLSWDRAMSVYHALVGRYGVDPARLLPMGRGMAEPLDPAHPDDPANRRVQFRVAG